MKSVRTLETVITAVPASDGAGVSLKRVMSSGCPKLMDPFLMLDEISSNDPDALGGGFPAHPHRGIETISYMLKGSFRHEDNLGNRREITSGGIQWMKSGKGIIHSEMPLPEQDTLHGFQIWLNQPASKKMSQPEYRDLSQQDIPAFSLNKVHGRVLLGSLQLGNSNFQSPIVRAEQDALLVDISLNNKQRISLPLNQKKVMIFVYQGKVTNSNRSISAGEFGIFSDKGALNLESEEDSRFLILAGQPLNESVVQHGPFVMNTREEILQTINDYQSGNFP
ncbi:hypothetical protein EOPP23_05860 [Endozoicomonas sp. OPT23]|uniref:pirin family protein n=1 Tax=Endozoicomonas sp. OPT23 TaxID=2072845 RepID=UPI00129BABE9|nr:pirin family protein [Endozoicomonas sp. OPT23]MRI32510.1 hypothetical protein [Endozoicomonas sp. OPT23]